MWYAPPCVVTLDAMQKACHNRLYAENISVAGSVFSIKPYPKVGFGPAEQEIFGWIRIEVVSQCGVVILCLHGNGGRCLYLNNSVSVDYPD